MEILDRYIGFFMITLAVMGTTACNSEDAFDCIKQSGNKITVKIDDLPDFSELILYDNIELEIVETDEEYFELTYGENLISKIVMEHENDSLSFFNQNFCGWTRDFTKPRLKWYTDKKTIDIKSLTNGRIQSADTLKNNLVISIQSAVNQVALNVNNGITALSSNSSTSFNIGGKSSRLSISAYFNDGKFDCENLITSRADILHRGYNDILVQVTDSLTGSIENAGRILYKGNPGIKVAVSNGGELIHLDQE